mmetsp:Transcript_73711/g.196137  ORF Transcript_73711/g.196137 Transcript_73711/m.196137 type:complete len:295 (+) Transcript_73711:988-1872(+)
MESSPSYHDRIPPSTANSRPWTVKPKAVKLVAKRQNPCAERGHAETSVIPATRHEIPQQTTQSTLGRMSNSSLPLSGQSTCRSDENTRPPPWIVANLVAPTVRQPVISSDPSSTKRDGRELLLTWTTHPLKATGSSKAKYVLKFRPPATCIKASGRRVEQPSISSPTSAGPRQPPAPPASENSSAVKRRNRALSMPAPWYAVMTKAKPLSMTAPRRWKKARKPGLVKAAARGVAVKRQLEKLALAMARCTTDIREVRESPGRTAALRQAARSHRSAVLVKEGTEGMAGSECDAE